MWLWIVKFFHLCSLLLHIMLFRGCPYHITKAKEYSEIYIYFTIYILSSHRLPVKKLVSIIADRYFENLLFLINCKEKHCKWYSCKWCFRINTAIVFIRWRYYQTRAMLNLLLLFSVLIYSLLSKASCHRVILLSINSLCPLDISFCRFRRLKEFTYYC